MPERPADAPLGRLTPLQQTAVDFARRDFGAACAADVTAMDAASLILLVERLRGRLGAVLGVLDEATAGGGT